MRAALIAVHLVAVTLAAFPTPSGRLTDENFHSAAFRQSLADWVPLARTLGVAHGEDALAAVVWGAGGRLVAARSAVLWPFQPYYALCGTSQSWKMFGSVSRSGARLEIDLQTNGAWSPMFQDQGADWNRRLFDEERVRALRWSFGQRRGRATYDRMVGWIGEQAAADFPGATAVRVRMRGVNVPPPGRAAVELSDAYWARTVTLRP